MKQYKKALCWIRRDLRFSDHAALSAACTRAEKMAIVFIFDTQILSKLSDKNDRRITFLKRSLEEMDKKLREQGSLLLVRYGDPIREIPLLAKKLGVDIVFANHDYEAYSIQRDKSVQKELQKISCSFETFKDQVIFERRELLTGSETPFKVFTAYKNAWLKKINTEHFLSHNTPLENLLPQREIQAHSHPWDWKSIGFEESTIWLEPGENAAHKRLQNFQKNILASYKIRRDFPAQEGTSGLSTHLRFGTISVRKALRMALEHKGIGADTWINELIWRDFYQMILSEFPQVNRHAFKLEYDSISWPGEEKHFKAWCEGNTGFPLIDAAMRHFNETGWMHNRLRMIVASFLVKDLLIDWKRGEKYFARYLLDYDFAANNGGWQWCASTGCDAQPYFRIFNPLMQSKKFDPQGDYIRKHCPELKYLSAKDIHDPPLQLRSSIKYPKPIVDHSIQRLKALALYKKE